MAEAGVVVHADADLSSKIKPARAMLPPPGPDGVGGPLPYCASACWSARSRAVSSR